MFHKEKPDYNRLQYGFYTIDELVPEDHFLRQVDAKVHFDFIYDLVEDTYSPDNGRPSLDPVMLVKIQCLQGRAGSTPATGLVEKTRFSDLVFFVIVLLLFQ